MRNARKYAVSAIAVFMAVGLCQGAETIDGFPRKITIRGVTFEVATPAELKAKGLDYAYPPPEENAALDYIAAMNVLQAAMTRNFPRRAYEYVLRNVWVDSPALGRWMDEHTDVYQHIRAGSVKPLCVFPIHNADYTLEILMPHLSGMRDLARFLIVRAKRNAYDDDYAGAADDLFLILRMAEQNRKDPFLIGGLVNIAIRAMAAGTLNDAVLRDDWPEDEELLRQVAARLAESQKALPAFSDGLKGERWMAHDCVRLFTESPQKAMTLVGRAKPGSPPLDVDGQRVRSALARILFPDRAMNRHFDYFYDRLEELDGLASPRAAKLLHAGFEEQVMREIPAWNVLANLLLPAISKAAQRYIDCEARIRLARAVVLLKLYKVKHGRWPERLSEVDSLTKPDLSDPFTGRPFLFVRRKDGWILYSVGADLAADRGHRKKDIVVRYPRPKPKPFTAK